MKTFFVLLGAACLTCGTAFAQSTMPALGASTPEGQVAKTDASINPKTEPMYGDGQHKRRMKTGDKPAYNQRMDRRTNQKMKMKSTPSSTM